MTIAKLAQMTPEEMNAYAAEMARKHNTTVSEARMIIRFSIAQYMVANGESELAHQYLQSVAK